MPLRPGGNTELYARDRAETRHLEQNMLHIQDQARYGLYQGDCSTSFSPR